MAKINVEFDTVEKTMSVTINGEAVENVENVEFWKSYSEEDQFRVGVTTVSHNKEDDMRTVQRVFASENPEGVLANETSGPTSLQKEIMDYINS